MAKKYIVLQDFTDKLTNRLYKKGDTFKHVGVRSERLEELKSEKHPHHNGAIITLNEQLDVQDDDMEVAEEVAIENDEETADDVKE